MTIYSSDRVQDRTSWEAGSKSIYSAKVDLISYTCTYNRHLICMIPIMRLKMNNNRSKDIVNILSPCQV